MIVFFNMFSLEASTGLLFCLFSPQWPAGGAVYPSTHCSERITQETPGCVNSPSRLFEPWLLSWWSHSVAGHMVLSHSKSGLYVKWRCCRLMTNRALLRRRTCSNSQFVGDVMHISERLQPAVLHWTEKVLLVSHVVMCAIGVFRNPVNRLCSSRPVSSVIGSLL